MADDEMRKMRDAVYNNFRSNVNRQLIHKLADWLDVSDDFELRDREDLELQVKFVLRAWKSNKANEANPINLIKILKPKNNTAELVKELIRLFGKIPSEDNDTIAMPEIITSEGDERKIVENNASKYPHNCIALMEIEGLAPTTCRGTGFLTENNKFLTCAHNVRKLFQYHQDPMNPAKVISKAVRPYKVATKIDLFFGLHGNRDEVLPDVTLNEEDIKSFYIPPGYDYPQVNGDLKGPNGPHDFASIDLSKYHGYIPKTHFYIEDASSNRHEICGYPGDKRKETLPCIYQWMVKDMPTRISQERQQLSYKGATFFGNSGSPVYWMKDDSKAMVTGIHVVGIKANDENYAVLIRKHTGQGSHCEGEDKDEVDFASSFSAGNSNASNDQSFSTRSRNRNQRKPGELDNASEVSQQGFNVKGKDQQTVTGRTDVKWDEVIDTVYKVVEKELGSSAFDKTLATTLDILGLYTQWSGKHSGAPLFEEVKEMLKIWKNHKNRGKESIDDLIKTLQDNQRAFGVQPLIVELENLRDNKKDPTGLVIYENQLDDFLDFVPKLLEGHPTGRADSVLALKLGNSIYQHYETWQCNQKNIGKEHHEKFCYLLNHWVQKNNFASMKALVMALDEKLKSESSFNMMREQIKQRYL